MCLAMAAVVWSMAAASATGQGDPGVVFEAEVVQIFVEPDSLRIEGHYFMRGSGDREQVVLLSYPYPQDSRLAGARTLTLEAITEAATCPLNFSERNDGRGVRWWVPVSPGRRVQVYTVYRQARLENFARYIVTTTQAWQRPLARARFEIYLPEGAHPVEFSHAFQPGEGDGGPCWVYEENDFWPERDISVRWE
jgi:hypothetical protein